MAIGRPTRWASELARREKAPLPDKAAHSSLFLQVGKAPLPDKAAHSSLYLQDLSQSLVAMESAAVTNRTICHTNLAIPSYERIGGRYVDRQGGVRCRTHTFQPGDTWTFVSFSRAVWNAHMNPYAQHTMLFLHVVPEAAADSTRVLPIGVTELKPTRYCNQSAASAEPSHCVKVITNKIL